MEDHKQEPRTISEVSERQALGERLRQARDYIGLSQEEVGRLLKLPRTAITGMESGQRRVEALARLVDDMRRMSGVEFPLLGAALLLELLLVEPAIDCVVLRERGVEQRFPGGRGCGQCTVQATVNASSTLKRGDCG